ncbi:MAG: His-Xaa-Ser system radical SAM maturase HxsB, partial [Cyanobacteria bacterium HKST-UBA02]|nr:His-Xaa-Ser system radical SAM maturase HxsB [Cyanobacteria bacterium HKST-UBA02]
QWLHNTNRPRPDKDSYEKTLEGIERIRARLGPDRVSALMTTTKESLPHVKDIIDEYVQLGFDGVFLRPLSPYGFAMKTQWYQAYDVSDWLDFYFRGLDYIIELNKNGHEFTEYYAAIILNKMFSATGTGYVDLQSPAGIGIAGIVFNYDGYVYASDESRMLAEMGDTKFRLGKLGRDSYEAIMTSDALLDTLECTMTECMPSCSDCGFQPFCGSDPLYHYATQKDPVGHKALSGFCKKNMAIFRRLITLMEDDPAARSVLLSWARP